MPALEDISLTVDAGRFVVIVGPSGCGKTSLLMMMAGLRHQTSGTILCAGRPITRSRSRPRRRRVPGGEPVSLADRARQHRVPAGIRGAPREERRRARRRHAQSGRPAGLRQPLSARAVGRHEAARLDRPRPGAGPARAADGRAVRRARRADAHDHGPRAAAHLVADRQDRGVRHPQPDRGGLSRRRGAGDVGAARAASSTASTSRCRARAPTR